MLDRFVRVFTHRGGIDEKDEERREKQLRAAYQQLFGTDPGKMILDDLANRFCFVGPTYRGDATEAVFNEGGRNVVLYILGMIRDDYKNPIKEVLNV